MKAPDVTPKEINLVKIRVHLALGSLGIMSTS